ncbi:MAG TPA: aminotransferase class V-fold PLP-dependent enzyme [Longimicrobiales bacterium]|nr:aminotransferase class V-fold PLP-dependent enzyme [Longimicrobiales bacterium]
MQVVKAEPGVRRASDIFPAPPASHDPIGYNPGTLTDPLPAVERAMTAFRKRVRARPIEAYSQGRADLSELREVCAEVFGGNAHNWAIADGHTATIDRMSNVMGQYFAGRVQVVSTFGEHIGGLGAFSSDPRVQVRQVPVDRIANTPGELFFISHVSYDTNRDNSDEIRRLSHRPDAPIVIVDGSQAIGQIDVDVTYLGCHAYLASGHKWLAGPHGTGLLYLRDDIVDVWPTPFRAGVPLCPELPIGKWEPRGGQDFSRICGLTTAIREFQLNKHRGLDQRTRFVRGLTRVLGPSVRVLDVTAPHGRVVVFEITGVDVYEVYSRLGQRGVSLKCIKKPERIIGSTGPLEVLRAGLPWWISAARVREAISHLKEVVEELTVQKKVAA